MQSELKQYLQHHKVRQRSASGSQPAHPHHVHQRRCQRILQAHHPKCLDSGRLRSSGYIRFTKALPARASRSQAHPHHKVPPSGASGQPYIHFTKYFGSASESAPTSASVGASASASVAYDLPSIASPTLARLNQPVPSASRSASRRAQIESTSTSSKLKNSSASASEVGSTSQPSASASASESASTSASQSASVARLNQQVRLPQWIASTSAS